jgi:hypothetical protein
MEGGVILRLVFALCVLFFAISSCGIKGSPLPSNTGAISQVTTPVVKFEK